MTPKSELHYVVCYALPALVAAALYTNWVM